MLDGTVGHPAASELVASGEIALDTEAVPLAEVTRAWEAPDHGRRIVFVP